MDAEGDNAFSYRISQDHSTLLYTPGTNCSQHCATTAPQSDMWYQNRSDVQVGIHALMEQHSTTPLRLMLREKESHLTAAAAGA